MGVGVVLLIAAVWVGRLESVDCPIDIRFDGLHTTNDPAYPYGWFTLRNRTSRALAWDATVEAPLDPGFPLQQGLSSLRGGGNLAAGAETRFQTLVAGKPGVPFRLVVGVQEPPALYARVWLGLSKGVPALKGRWNPPPVRTRPVYGEWCVAWPDDSAAKLVRNETPRTGNYGSAGDTNPPPLLAAAYVETNTLEFGVFWPPQAPDVATPSDLKPLLEGRLTCRVGRSTDHRLAAHFRLRLARPSDEAGREFWNSRLAFPEYDWMRYVRVWDGENRWLWPNLPYLLRLHGTERIERYGGVDPGKGVDNDFAAVLIRRYDAVGGTEHEQTRHRPLVAAEWYAAGASRADKQTVVHLAESDEFTLDLGRAGEPIRGLAALWLIYADFMGAKPPASWPQTPEYAGGILAYFEVQWDLQARVGERLSVRQKVPRSSTGFDWEQWARRCRAVPDPRKLARVSDAPPVAP